MRTWIAIAMLLALGACGEKKEDKPDFSKMEAGEACRVISKRVFECKDEVKKQVSAALKMAGAPDSDVAAASGLLDQPLSCDGVEQRALDTMKTCFDHDCKKLAACVVPMVTDGFRRAGPATTE